MIRKLVEVYYYVWVGKGRDHYKETHSVLVVADSLEEAVIKFKKDFPKVTAHRCQSYAQEVVL